jgi:hypothetical protein
MSRNIRSAPSLKMYAHSLSVKELEVLRVILTGRGWRVGSEGVNSIVLQVGTHPTIAKQKICLDRY